MGFSSPQRHLPSSGQVGRPPPGGRDRSLGERQSPEDPGSLCPSSQTPPASAPHLSRPSPLPHGTSRSSSKLPTAPAPIAGVANEATFASDAGECPGAAVMVAWWRGSHVFWTALLLLTIPASLSSCPHPCCSQPAKEPGLPVLMGISQALPPLRLNCFSVCLSWLKCSGGQ